MSAEFAAFVFSEKEILPTRRKIYQVCQPHQRPTISALLTTKAQKNILS